MPFPGPGYPEARIAAPIRFIASAGSPAPETASQDHSGQTSPAQNQCHRFRRLRTRQRREFQPLGRSALVRAQGKYQTVVADTDRIGDVPARRDERIEKQRAVGGIPDPAACVAKADDVARVVQNSGSGGRGFCLRSSCRQGNGRTAGSGSCSPIKSRPRDPSRHRHWR